MAGEQQGTTDEQQKANFRREALNAIIDSCDTGFSMMNERLGDRGCRIRFDDSDMTRQLYYLKQGAAAELRKMG